MRISKKVPIPHGLNAHDRCVVNPIDRNLEVQGREKERTCTGLLSRIKRSSKNVGTLSNVHQQGVLETVNFVAHQARNDVEIDGHGQDRSYTRRMRYCGVS